MSHRTSLANNEDPSVAQQDTAQAVNQPSTSSPSTMQHSVQMPDSGAQNTTSTPPTTGAIIAFFNSMKSHYATLLDPVSPHLFTQLCRDYNTGKSDETQFYVAAYRLFYETNAMHLMTGFCAFLPTTWREVDLEWLHEAVKGASERQRASAREAFGELAAMAESGMSVPSTPSGSAAAKQELDLEASATQPARHKKRTPLNGFRATYRTDLEPHLETPLSPRSDSDESSTYPRSSASPPPARRGRSNNNTSPLKKRLARQKNKAPSSTASSRTASNGHNTPTRTPSTPLPTNKVSKLPTASSINHLGTVYPTRRTIIARSNKPFIHALCGMAFGHPAEVQRHHNGQGGRPGCWEKSGKPAGDEGRWDKHDSCKVKLADVQYVKVQGGWVVTSWGSAAAEEMLGAYGGEEPKGETAKLGAATDGEGKKRKAAAKPQQAHQVESRATSEDEDESQSADDEEEAHDDMEPLSPQEPGAKRHKPSKMKESEVLVSEEQVAAAARAVALGLRTRK